MAAPEPAERTAWTPLPGPQTDAYNCPADELYYGGAAGGGKTFLLCGLATEAHERSVIFRREYRQLREIIRNLDTLTSGRARVNHTASTWVLNNGATIELGAVQHAEDVRKWQGQAHDLLAFDEIAHFEEAQYRFLSAWCRTANPRIRPRVVATGNPPTQAGQGQWVRKLWAPWLDRTFPRPAKSGELRWYVREEHEDRWVDGPGEYEVRKGSKTQPAQARSRCFIFARVEDNPHYMATGYVDTLMALPEPLRSQLRWGDYDAVSEDDPWQIIPTGWVIEANRRWSENRHPRGPLDVIGVDVARGGDDWTVCAPRRGRRCERLHCVPGRQTRDGPAVVREILRVMGADSPLIHIDPLAVGSSPLDLLRESEIPVCGINFAGAAKDWQGKPRTDRSGSLRMFNERAWAYWSLREALDPISGDSVELPPDPELLAELTAGRYLVTTAGIRLEPKDDIATRIGRSPDRADAVALAFYPLSPEMMDDEDEDPASRAWFRREMRF